MGYVTGHRGSVEDRFWKNVDVRDSNGCWIWTGSISGTGYGVLWADGKLKGTHRIAWELLVGPIPKGFVIDHDHPDFGCHNRSCVNPGHLQAVSEGVNVWRQKRRVDNTSGERGIRWDVSRKKWSVEVRRDGKRFRRRYSDLEQARAARDAVHAEINRRDG